MRIDRDVIDMIDAMLRKGYEVELTIFDTQVAVHIKPGNKKEQELPAEPEKPEKTKAEKREQIVDMYVKHGKAVKDIAKEVGLSEQTIRNYLKAAGY